MRVWIVQVGELLRGIDDNARDYRGMLLARELAGRGHEVVRWANTFEHTKKRFRFSESRTVALSPNLTVRLVHALPGYQRNISIARWLQNRRMVQLFHRESESWPRPDLIFAGLPVPELAEGACCLGRRWGIPVVVDVRDLWPDVYLTPLPEAFRPLARLLLTSEFRRSSRVLNSATAITAISETYFSWAFAQRDRQASPDDGVFPLGVVDQQKAVTAKGDEGAIHARLGIVGQPFVVSFAGTFGNSYDITTVVRAARLLEARGRKTVHIVMAGDGQARPRARELAVGLSNISLPGWLDEAEVRAMNGIAGVGLCAYAVGALQSLPIKIAEYLVAGLPLISSLKGEMQDLLERTGCGRSYAAGNPESLADTIEWIVDHPRERQDMAARAHELFLRRFDAAVIYPALATRVEAIGSRAKRSFAVELSR